MATVSPDKLMTMEEFLALPDDGIERWLIDGQLHEASSMTIRNRWHTQIESRLSQLLGNWLDEQPLPRGELHAGEAGVRLRSDPNTIVGVDIVYMPPSAGAIPQDTSIIQEVPILAIEILSPHDQVEEIEAKIDIYLECGVRAVWVVNPYRRTITVAQPGQEATLFNCNQELSADPYLPGFRTPVIKVFER